MSDLYPVHETFHSWQGEGTHMGKSAFFIRLFGCPVHCPWCDSAGTWHPEFIPSKVDRRTAEALANVASAANPEIVIITGGEPTIHDLGPLCEALKEKRLSVHLETCGAFEIKGSFDWITLSPKRDADALDASLKRASEFKIIVESPEGLDFWIEKLGPCFGDRTVWLHPEWSCRNNADTLNAITDTVKMKGRPYRAGYQVHKLFRADNLDSRSRKAAPLGGDPSKGF